ncbi:M3 family metallopeptidase [Parasphingopyxis marina]|uniref:M3 family metallopeptidase n=1 Tax=Parasphingopyxis marina TaxID=2761622 RepID=A0A842HT92_9SPHN|nr:M3 family metallopeptidase [Parasphingopyxis marina]MBC2777108.1 M3 family metallopeptidase [Parasphingopyxis marina]
MRKALFFAVSGLALSAYATIFSEDRAMATERVAAPANDADQNPLLADWAGPFEGVPPWDEMRPELFGEAFETAMAEMRAEVQAIIDNPEAPTFANTNEAMELIGDRMSNVQSMFGVAVSNVSNDEYRAVQREWSPQLASFYQDVYLQPGLIERYRAVYESRNDAGLTPAQIRLAERDYEQLVRAGATLEGAERERLDAITAELAGLYTEFSNKLLADEETYVLLDSEDDLAGLPDSLIGTLRAAAEERELEGWAVVNTRSFMQPFLQYSTRRDLREQVWRAYVNRGDNGDANDTNATIAAILALRAERAALLGFETHAHLRMADTMAGTPENATELMMRVWPAAVARVHEEVADMQAIADAEGAGITIEPWDYRFYAEKVRQDRYSIDESEIKPYLQLQNMIQAMFYSAERLYDLHFEENTGAVPVFHPDVRTFAVTNSRTGEDVGLFYLDTYARTGKRSGAWMTTYRSQQTLGGERNVLASNNNNFSEPAEGEVALISLDDARTLFHEFGHGIHYLLQDVYYPGLAGTPRDFVEYPSQVNENWVLTRDVLNRFATHYETGEPMPQELVDRIEASDTFNQGFATVEYLSSALVDMRLHNRAEPVTDIDAFERETLAEMGMPDEIVMRHRLPQFGHLFSSDAYSAGYYSYLWSETMDADTWEAFVESGDVWNREIADRFRETLLSTGNVTDRAEAYREFRGRDPDVDALLRKRGFPVPSEETETDD